MSKLSKSRIAGAIGLATGLVMAGGMFIGSAGAQTVDQLQAQIQSLLATIQSLQTQIAAMGGGSTTTSGGTGVAGVPAGYTFTRNLTNGSTGADVMNLQKVLNSDPATQLAASGVGSPGNETSYFGPITKAAVVKFQNKYASEVLTPVGLSAGTGYVGPSTRAKLNQMTAMSTGGTTGGTTTGGTTGGGVVSGFDQLTVSSPAQPSNSLAVYNAARVPFTNVTLTAGSKDVTVNTITIQRAGLAQDNNFSSIVLLDENGTQIGNSKTLNSNHQAVLDAGVTISAGTSRTFTIAGNMAAQATVHAGEVAVLQVVSVDASSPVSGTLPVSGAQNTINATLALGTATVQTSSLTDTSTTLNIGDTDHVFGGVRVTAGSNEGLKVNSIRWYQSGSVGQGDIDSIRTVVDGTEYPTTLSSDGKYYTTVFSPAITIDKGNAVEMTVKGNIIGGSNRTVKFDIYKATDLNITGAVYGYGITPSANSTSSSSNSSQQLTTTTPWYDGIQKTIQAGNVTTVYKASSVPAQNIGVGVADQPLGGFVVSLKSEPIQVQQMVFTIATTSTWGGKITSVGLYDQNGNLVAGPVDQASGAMTVTFTDTVTIPTGDTTYTLKGKIPTSTASGATVVFKTTPSSQWSNVTGQITGDTISLSSLSSQVSMNTMTVKPVAVTVSVSGQPASQNVVLGSTDVTMANFQFDATASGEDARVSSAAFNINTPTGASYPTNCFAWDGTTRLNNTAVSPSSDGDKTFTFSNSVTIPKGTVKTISIHCDFPGTLDAASSSRWSVGSTAVTITGVTSGQSSSATLSSGNGGTMTYVSTGSYTVTKDASSPAYKIVSGGQTGVTLGTLKIHATNEDIKISKLPLQLTNTASSTANDLLNGTVGLYNESGTQVGSAIFAGSASTSIANFTSNFIVPKDTDAKLVLKGSLSDIGTGKAGTEGHVLAVDYDNNASSSGEATGMQSGSSASDASTADTAMSGVRIFNSFPTIARVTLPSATLSNGSSKHLLRFSVTADSQGDLALSKFTLTFATTTANVSSVNIFGFTDSGFSSAISGVNASGQLMNANQTPTTTGGSVEIYAQDTSAASTTVTIPHGQTYYFDVQGTVANSASGASVQTTLGGDSNYPSMATPSDTSTSTALMLTAAGVDGDTNDNFIWSPLATTTSVTTNDWTNGYGVAGLPASGISDTLSQ